MLGLAVFLAVLLALYLLAPPVDRGAFDTLRRVHAAEQALLSPSEQRQPSQVLRGLFSYEAGWVMVDGAFVFSSGEWPHAGQMRFQVTSGGLAVTVPGVSERDCLRMILAPPPGRSPVTTVAGADGGVRVAGAEQPPAGTCSGGGDVTWTFARAAGRPALAEARP